MTADDLLKGASADDMLKTPKPAPAKPEHPWQAVNRAARDPGATIPGSENLPHPAALLAETGAMLVTPGLPLAGRIAASGVAGGIKAASGGEQSPVKRGLVDAGTAALFEGILSGVAHVKIPRVTSSLADLAGRVTGRKDQFARATKAIDTAMDAIAPRLPPGTTLYVPAISPKKLTVDEVREGWKKLEGGAYDAARRQIHAELKEIDKAAGKSLGPGGGQNLYTAPELAAKTLKKRFSPPSSGAERFAEQAVNTLGHPTTRAAADVASTTDVSGFPAGAILPLSAMGASGGDLKGFLRHLR